MFILLNKGVEWRRHLMMMIMLIFVLSRWGKYYTDDDDNFGNGGSNLRI
jgi:hypothetical protein